MRPAHLLSSLAALGVVAAPVNLAAAQPDDALCERAAAIAQCTMAVTRANQLERLAKDRKSPFQTCGCPKPTTNPGSARLANACTYGVTAGASRTGAASAVMKYVCPSIAIASYGDRVKIERSGDVRYFDAAGKEITEQQFLVTPSTDLVTIKTGPNARILLYGYSDTLQLGPSSEASVSEGPRVPAPTPTAAQRILSLWIGTCYYVSSLIGDEDREPAINTPCCAGGIRGTKVSVAIAPDKSETIVLEEGAVDFRVRAAGKVYSMTPSQTLKIGPKGVVDGPKPLGLK